MGSAQLARSLAEVSGVALRALRTGTDFDSVLGHHTAEFVFAIRSAAVTWAREMHARTLTPAPITNIHGGILEAPPNRARH